MTESKQQRIKQRILEEFVLNPLVEPACRKAGISRATYYRWLEADTDFYDDVEMAQAQGRDRVNDMAESALMKGIRAEDFRSVKYWLDHNHRRYIKKRPAKRPFKKLKAVLKYFDRDEDW